MNWPLVILLAFLLLWDLAWWLAGVRQLAPWRLKGMLRRGEPVELVDVRTPVEQKLFHIPGARSFWDLTEDELARGDSPVAVICMSGHRSPPIARTLSRKLDRPVANLTGGMLAWLAVLGPVESGGMAGRDV